MTHSTTTRFCYTTIMLGIDMTMKQAVALPSAEECGVPDLVLKKTLVSKLRLSCEASFVDMHLGRFEYPDWVT